MFKVSLRGDSKTQSLDVPKIFADPSMNFSRNLDIQKKRDEYGPWNTKEVLEHLKVGIILYDVLYDGQDFIISYINPIMEKITELKKEEVIGNKITQLSPELAELGFLKILRNVNDRGTSKKCDVSVYERDELIHWSKNHFEKLTSGKILSVHYDITTLKKSDERYDKVFNNSNHGLAIFQNNHIIHANNAFSQLAGFPLDKIYNMSFIELNELFFNDDKYDLWHCVNDLTSGKEISKQREFSIHKDGSKQWLHCYAVQINYHGKPAIQVSFDDITERINTRETLKKSQKELIEIQGLSKIGSFQHDILTEEITGTPEFFKITGFNSKFPLYLPSFYKIVPPEDLEAFKENVKKSFNETTEFHFWIKTPNSQAKYLKTKTTPHFSEDGKPLTVVGYVYDITKLKKYETKLLSALNEKDILLREIQHRVRNNLQLIMSLLNLQSNFKNYNIDDVLKSSKSRVKSMALTQEVYNTPDLTQNTRIYINKLVEYLFHIYNINNKLIPIDTDIDDTKLEIETLIPLGLIINELITNSLKHAFPNKKGKINITLKTTNTNILNLKITDNGIGIPQTININNTQTLGLKIVKILTEQLDGTIQINTNPGTTYTITLKKQHYQKRT